jgi:hypothetical protein
MPGAGEPAAKAPVQEGMSKADAVRAALSEGIEAPQEAVAFIKHRFGIEMGAQHFSSVKSQQKKREGAPAARRGRKPKQAAADGYVAPPPRPAASGGSDLLDAMEAMKPLIAQYGADQVKRIVDLLG